MVVGAALRIPGITDKDKHDLEHFAVPQQVDIVSGSFVRSAANVRYGSVFTSGRETALCRLRIRCWLRRRCRLLTHGG